MTTGIACQKILYRQVIKSKLSTKKAKYKIPTGIGLISFVYIFLFIIHSLFLAENFKRCHRSDPDIDNCLKAAIQNAFKIIGSTGECSIFAQIRKFLKMMM